MMRRLLIMMAVLCVALTVLSGLALAANPGTHGQPGQSCQSEPNTPGGAATTSSPGAPFNESGVSGGVYANGPGTGGPGTATGTGHITNPTAVSQYDVACFQVSQPGHP
jgi:hypothetical protein